MNKWRHGHYVHDTVYFTFLVLDHLNIQVLEDSKSIKWKVQHSLFEINGS